MRDGNHLDRHFAKLGLVRKGARNFANHVYDCVVHGIRPSWPDAVAAVGIDGNTGYGLVVNGTDDENVADQALRRRAELVVFLQISFGFVVVSTAKDLDDGASAKRRN